MDFHHVSFGNSQAYQIVNPDFCSIFLHQINFLYGVNPVTIAKFPGAQPCSIMRQDMCMLQAEPYMVAEKTDGTRYLMLVTRAANGTPFVVLIDRSLTMRVVQVDFDAIVHDSITLFDGEMVVNEHTGKWQYLIFDLIGSGNRMRGSDNFGLRLQNASTIVQYHMRVHEKSDPFSIYVKRFSSTLEIQALVSAVDMHQGRRSDGLILVPVNRNIKPYRNSLMFKWKKQTHHTIDCLLHYNSKKAQVSAKVPVSMAIENIAKCQRRTILLSPRAIAKSVILKELVAKAADSVTLARSLKKTPLPRVAVRSKPADHDLQANIVTLEIDNSNISPNSVDFQAFEFYLIDSGNNLCFFGNCDAELNRAFLQQHCTSIVSLGQDMVVECSADTLLKELRWKIMLARKDRAKPNTEYTVQRTIENIQENITLPEIIACFEKTSQGAWSKPMPQPPQQKRERHQSGFRGRGGAWRGSRRGGHLPFNPSYGAQRFQQPSRAPVTWQEAMQTTNMHTMTMAKRKRENSDHRPQWLIDKQNAEQARVVETNSNEEYDPNMPQYSQPSTDNSLYYDYGDEEESESKCLKTDCKANAGDSLQVKLNEPQTLQPQEKQVDVAQLTLNPELLNMLAQLESTIKNNPTSILKTK